MAAQLPPLNFGEGLRIVLLPSADDDAPSSENPKANTNQEPDSNPNPNPFEDPEEPAETETLSANDDVAPESDVPQHPIPSFQDAFAESLREATAGTAGEKPKLRNLDAKARREVLLGQDKDDEPFDASWRYRAGQNQHEVLKLIAQISFGVYLLLNGMANSNSQVINILQGHIDEIDEFLEVAMEDLNQAVDDLTKRIQHLKLPMANMKVFEQLLEDRQFRAEILEGNEKIDAIVTRTNAAMRQWDDDIEAGLRGSTVFSNWLHDQQGGAWNLDQPELADVYDAMKGNAEGWLNAFESMNDRAQEINGLTMTLMTIITEMESKAGEVSRRTWNSVQPFTTPLTKNAPRPQQLGTPSPPPSLHSHSKSPSPATHSAVAPNPALALTPNESTKDDDEDDDIFYPLPGGLPLLPPTRTRPSFDTASQASKQTPMLAPESPVIGNQESPSDTHRSSASSEVPLYVLQPRTYTPQPPAPLPSPMLRNTSSPLGDIGKMAVHDESEPLQRKPSLRDRVANPPESIRIPPPLQSPLYAPSPSFATPRTSNSVPYEPSAMSGTDSHSRRQRSRGGSSADISLSELRNAMPSPMSDHRPFRRVRASPQSPLQQRPHTAADPRRPPGTHLRSPPSQLGAMSTLSGAPSRNYDSRGPSPSAASQTTERQLKKKKSGAFGWFKKAFTMDEEERAAFEYRKAMAARNENNYYNNTDSPRFLDGKRIR